MRLINVANLTPGLIIGRPVIDDKGQVLLNKGVELSPLYIEALREKGYPHVYIADADEGIVVEGDEDLNPVTRSKAIQTLQKAFDAIEKHVPELRDKSYETLSKTFASESFQALMRKGGAFEGIEESVNAIMQEVLTRSTLAGLASIRSVDSEMYHHSVDVCVVAVMIGKAIGLPSDRIRQLAVGCLLHDIGKLFTDPNANRISQVRQHTLLGYELLKNCPNPDILAPRVALEHHEWQDGSGEPRGLVGSNRIERDRKLPPPVPTLVGEIAAVANVYDNLLTGSLGQPPMSPDQVVQAIRSASGTHLNREIVSTFVRLVPVFPLGTEVLMRSGEFRGAIGIVKDVKPHQLDRPTVMLFKDQKGQPISPVEIDLAAHPEVLIRSRA
jgi:putative nucleotidyltransferase with HDIG domain